LFHHNGDTLFKYIERSPTESDVTMWTTQIASDLQYLHETLRMLHRDITGHNIMVHDDDRKIKLINFGLVKVVNTSVVRTQGCTLFYTSRERSDCQEYDTGDNMWGFGCTNGTSQQEGADRSTLDNLPWRAF
jgi:serine/threonine protein kinase